MSREMRKKEKNGKRVLRQLFNHNTTTVNIWKKNVITCTAGKHYSSWFTFHFSLSLYGLYIHDIIMVSLPRSHIIVVVVVSMQPGNFSNIPNNSFLMKSWKKEQNVWWEKWTKLWKLTNWDWLSFHSLLAAIGKCSSKEIQSLPAELWRGNEVDIVWLQRYALNQITHPENQFEEKENKLNWLLRIEFWK